MSLFDNYAHAMTKWGETIKLYGEALTQRDEARQVARRLLAERDKWAHLANTHLKDLQIERVRNAALRTEREAIEYAAHMPADYEYGLPSWINQKLYCRLIEMTDKDGLPIRRTEDVERMIGLERENAALRAELDALRGVSTFGDKHGAFLRARGATQPPDSED